MRNGRKLSRHHNTCSLADWRRVSTLQYDGCFLTCNDLERDALMGKVCLNLLDRMVLSNPDASSERPTAIRPLVPLTVSSSPQRQLSHSLSNHLDP